jgi:hypothetical protein
VYGTDANETYYRVDWLESDSVTFRSILRNHRYVVNIVDVTGRGYTTHEEAFVSKSVNMKTEILGWSDASFGHITYDGHYYIGVDPVEFELSRDARTGKTVDNLLRMVTNYPAWTATVWDDEAGTTQAGTWLTLAKNPDGSDQAPSVTGTANDANTPQGDSLYLITTLNSTTLDRTAWVHITAGRLVAKIRVMQQWQTPVFIHITDTLGVPITELTFAANNGTAGVAPAAQRFRVTWSPTHLPLEILQPHETVGANAFTWTDANYTWTEIPASYGGSALLTINPPMMDVSSDPFYTRGTKVTFKIDNGAGTIENESITLRQINPALTATADQSYILDGTQKTFNVRSNMPWWIETITDDDNIIANENDIVLTGGTVDPTAGYNKQFLVQNLTFTPVDLYKTAGIRVKASNGQYVDVQIKGYSNLTANGWQFYPVIPTTTHTACSDYCAGLGGGWMRPTTIASLGTYDVNVVYMFRTLGIGTTEPTGAWGGPTGGGANYVWVMYEYGGQEMKIAASAYNNYQDVKRKCMCVRAI